MTATDPTTLALTGQLPFILSLGAILAFPLSFLLLRLYRRAVLKGMNRRSERPTGLRKVEAAVRAEQGERASGDLRLSIVDAAAEQAAGHAGETLYRRACSNPWRAGLVYLAGGCLFAAVMAFSFLQASNSEILPMREARFAVHRRPADLDTESERVGHPPRFRRALSGERFFLS